MTGSGRPTLLATPSPRGSVLAITVTPRSSRNQITAEADGTLRIRVIAPPVDGAANAAVLRLLADAIGIRRSGLEILSGESSRKKRILVHALASGELVRRLEQALDVPG